MSKLLKYTFRPQNYMGACFQAPCTAPGQRPMEMHQGEHLKQSLFFIHSKIVQHVTDMLDSLGIGCWGFLQYLTQMGFGPNTASHFTIFPIDTSKLFATQKKIYIYIHIEIMFCIKSTKSMLAVLNYGCMFPGSPCHTQTETNGNAPCSLIMLCIAVCLIWKITQVCTKNAK